MSADFIPTRGAIVEYHDPRGGQVWPAIVVRRRDDGLLNLAVFTDHGSLTVHKVGHHESEFGHWGWPAEGVE